MHQQILLARKKTVVLAASLGMYCMLLLILPPAAVRHGIPAVWIVMPLCGIAILNMVFLLFAARDVLVLKSGGSNGLR